MKTITAEKILNAASELVRTRHKVHGQTERSFDMIAQLWNAYLLGIADARNEETDIKSHDVAQMMVLLKIARTAYGSSEDHFIDEAGYAALAGMLKDTDDD